MYIKNIDAYYTKMIDSKTNISTEIDPPPPEFTNYLVEPSPQIMY